MYPMYQNHRGKKKWTLLYLPAACIASSVPLVMMGGIVRPAIGAVLVCVTGYLVWNRARGGWRLKPPPEEHEVHLEET